MSGNSTFARWGMKASEKLIIFLRILRCLLADRSEIGRIAYCFMRACIRKVIWLSMRHRVFSGRGEFKPMEIPPATFEVESSLRKLGEEVTICSFMKRMMEGSPSEFRRKPRCFANTFPDCSSEIILLFFNDTHREPVIWFLHKGYPTVLCNLPEHILPASVK